jgi:hypothetical protein
MTCGLSCKPMHNHRKHGALKAGILDSLVKEHGIHCQEVGRQLSLSCTFANGA